ncbi:unnamed protein product, partial [Mesorhabditis spiculigera]
MVAETLTHVDENSLAGTPITWEMIEQDIQRRYKTTAVTGKKRSAKLMADGNGFVSFIVLVEFDWLGGTDELPDKAVVKITSCEKLEKLSHEISSFPQEAEVIWQNCKAANDNELDFYQLWAHNFPAGLRIPKFYCGRHFGEDGVDAGYFAIEHFDKVESRHFYHNVQESAVLEILDQLALVNAQSLLHPEKFAAFDNENADHLHRMFASYEAVTKALDEAEEKNPNLLDKLHTLRTQTKYFETLETFQGRLSECCNGTKIFCHGDMWLGNMLWRKDAETQDYYMLVIIDWQLCNMGNPMEDLVRLLTAVISGQEYQRRKTFYLSYYYDALKKLADNVALPWTSYEDFEKKYEMVFVLISAMFQPMIMNFGPTLLKTVKDESQLEICTENYMDKANNMLDEAVHLIKKWNL